MKKIIKLLPIVLLLFVLWFSYNLIRYSGRDQCGISGNRVATNAPTFILRLVNGKPDDIQSLPISGEKIYTYENVTLFGHKSSSICYREMLFRTWKIEAYIPVEDNERDTLFETVSRSLQEQYQKLNGFYCNEITDENGSVIGQDMGSSAGPPFISVSLYFSNGFLCIEITDMR